MVPQRYGQMGRHTTWFGNTALHYVSRVTKHRTGRIVDTVRLLTNYGNYPLLRSAFRHPWISPTMHCWLLMLRCISHHPRHVACVTVQLITVSKYPVSSSFYSR